jgi:hypothetical protein
LSGSVKRLLMSLIASKLQKRGHHGYQQPGGYGHGAYGPPPTYGHHGHYKHHGHYRHHGHYKKRRRW